MNMFKEHPIIGSGGNSFITRMRLIGYTHIAYSHNNYTEMLCTLGIIGFIIYYSKWLLTLFKLLKINKKNKNNKIKDKKAILFLVIIVLFLILDYGSVSYVLEFNMFMLCLIDMYLSIEEEKNLIEYSGVDKNEK